MSRVRHDQRKLWEAIKPFRGTGLTNLEIAAKLFKQGWKTSSGGKLDPGYISSVTLVQGGEQYRQRASRRGEKRNQVATASEATAAALKIIAPTFASGRTGTETATTSPTVSVLATLAQIADISMSNLEISTKKKLVRDLAVTL